MIHGELYLKLHLKLNKMKKLVRTIFFSLVEFCFFMIISLLIISIYNNTTPNGMGMNGIFDNIFRIIFYMVLFLIPTLLLSIMPVYKYSYEGKNKWLWIVSYYQLAILIPFFIFFSCLLFLPE